MNSDKAVSALMGKHISEGKRPPIFWYGQLYQGSLKEHFSAILFRIFGYSTFTFMLTPLLFYLAFLSVQFFLFKETFSYNFALAACLFYCLPLGSLTRVVVWDSAGGLPLILLFGSLIIFLSYLIVFKNRENLTSTLGFIMGLAFFSHQIAFFFLLTSFFLIIAKFKFHLKKYLDLFLYAILGCFPLILNEFMDEFVLTKYLLRGERGAFTWNKVEKTFQMVHSLFSQKENLLGKLCLMLLPLGLLTIIFVSLKKRKFLAHSIYVLFAVVFLLFYFSSGFSDKYLVRYVSPLYFVLPVLLVSVFLLIRAKIKYILMALFILFLFLFNNLEAEYSSFVSNKTAHHYLKKIVSEINLTQEKYWQAPFWTAYRLTAVSKENIIVDSYTVKRYFPYWLFYYNQGQNNNFIFQTPEIKEYRREHFIRLLNRFNIKHKIRNVGNCWLVYDIEGNVFPASTTAPIPEEIPQLVLVKSKQSRGYLQLFFESKTKSQNSGFTLSAEISGYSSATKRFSSEKNQLKIELPIPRKGAFKIKYHLNYAGLKIPSTEKEIDYSLPQKKSPRKRKNLMYLSGFGPRKTIQNRKMAICEKEIRLEINKNLRKKKFIHVYLYSHIEFNHPYWYGDFQQHVSAFMNDALITESDLEPGENKIVLDLENFRLKRTGNILSLKFRYVLPLPQAPLWKVASLLEKVEFK